MKISSLKTRIFLLLFLISVLPISAFVALIYFNAFLTCDTAFFLKSFTLGIAILGFLSFFATLYYVQKTISKILQQLKKGLIAVEAGDFERDVIFPELDEFNEISDAYNRMKEKLKAGKRELELQALEIYAKNIEIQQTNMELEASYGQLQATINQLNDSEQKYYSLVKSIADIVCVIRLDGNIYFINEIVRDILGYSRQEIEGRNIRELIKPGISETFIEKVSNELKTKNSLTIELEFMHKNKNFILTEATLTNFVYDGEIIGIQAIIRDITQKKKMEQEIIASYKEAATINSLSRKLNATLEIDNVINMIVAEICRVLRNPFCLLRLIDEEGKNLIPKAYAGEYLEAVISNVEDLPVMNADNSYLGQLLSNLNKTDTILIHDFSFSETITQINATKKPNEKIKELLVTLIKTKERKIGVLVLGTTTKFNSRQKSLLSSISNNAAIAIENAQLFDMSRKNFIKTVNALIAAIEAKDNYTRGHSYRVSKFAVVIAEKMGLPKEQIDEIRIAGILHDVGKIGIPDAILRKPSRLTDDEFEQIKKHPTISRKILEPVGLSEATIKAIACHHERWDGKGYPFGISKEGLSIEAQIISVADALDAMTSNRAYRSAMSEEDAINEILRCKDSQFSPEVVEALSELFKSGNVNIFEDLLEQ
ncbi:MAG: HD domain-containing phosphohydrolase [Deltaproteobacteria bacterium]